MKRAPVFIGFAILATALVAPAPALARTLTTVSYPFEQVWPAAVRLVRIDEGHTIVEKDMEAGYILFEITEEQGTFRASLEVARTTDDSGRPASRVIVDIVDRPAYMEQGLLDRLASKLRREHGDPPPPRQQPPEKKPKPKQPAEEPAQG